MRCGGVDDIADYSKGIVWIEIGVGDGTVDDIVGEVGRSFQKQDRNQICS